MIFFVVTFKKNSYSFINSRQIHIFFNQAKTCHKIVCLLLCFHQFTCFENKIVLKSKPNIFMHKTSKNAKENKVFEVIFWFYWRKYGSVSNLISCSRFLPIVKQFFGYFFFKNTLWELVTINIIAFSCAWNMLIFFFYSFLTFPAVVYNYCSLSRFFWNRLYF